MSPSRLDALTWKTRELGDAVASLAREYDKPVSSIPKAPEDLAVPSAAAHWMEAAATAVGLEVEPVNIPFQELESVLSQAKCLLLPRRQGYLVLLRGGPLRVTLLAPGLRSQKVSRRGFARELRREHLAELETGSVGALLSLLDLPRDRPEARERLISELSPAAELPAAWLFRLAPGEPYSRQLLRAGLPGALLAALVLGLLEAGLGAASWLIFGLEALRGRLDGARLLAWALLLLFAIPLQLGASWLLGEHAVRVGLSFKRRLFDGALRFSVDTTRRDGVGGLLGRVNEATAVESLFVAGGLTALSVAADWVVALVLLAHTGFPLASVVLFLLLTLVMLALATDLMQKQQRWMLARIRMTRDFVERMIGYRTRVVQEPRERWHEAEDRDLEGYIGASRELDERLVLYGTLPRILPVLGLALLLPVVLASSASGLGGLVLVLIAVTTASSALAQLWGLFGLFTSGLLAWRSAGPLFRASTLEPTAPHLFFQDAVAQTRAGGDTLLEARDISFRYATRPRPVLSGCNLKVQRGARILIRGASGRGKSTFGAILAGLRLPESGLLLVRGIDRYVLTEAHWRATVAAVPQFHENHIFTNSLAFNLLMGRGWPPAPKDLEDAWTTCRELGLGPLVTRMPGGLFEPVGETGWQLSHGERSRVYVARALLQRADVTILDESFGALDPETLAEVMPNVLRRAGTLIVLAHP